jgi:ATP adenylyltransferase
MKRIWSPWRMEYIVGERHAGCVFCDKTQETQDSDNLILLRGEHCFIMLNRYPYNNGHLMVVPYAHVSSPTQLPPPAVLEMMTLVNTSLEVLQESMAPDGFNVGMNLGIPAGAGIADHLHMHVVPRWTGDTNFMSVLGETRVIVEALQACYSKLKPLFDCRSEPKPDPQAPASES